MLPNKTPLLILAALIGGACFPGLFVVLVAFKSVISGGEVFYSIFGLFLFGALASVGTLWNVMRKFEKDMLKRLGVEK